MVSLKRQRWPGEGKENLPLEAEAEVEAQLTCARVVITGVQVWGGTKTEATRNEQHATAFTRLNQPQRSIDDERMEYAMLTITQFRDLQKPVLFGVPVLVSKSSEVHGVIDHCEVVSGRLHLGFR